jgi:hypothetical protein
MLNRLHAPQFLGAIALLAAPAGAQVVEPRYAPPAVYFGAQPLYALTVGEFSDHVTAGGGLDLYVVYPVGPASPFALRADGGFIIMARRRSRPVSAAPWAAGLSSMSRPPTASHF